MSTMVWDFDRWGDTEVVDRRSSVWQDPKTWMQLFGLILSGCAILLSFTLWFATRMLDTVKQIDAKITAQNLATAISTKSQDGEIKRLTENQIAQWAFLRDQMNYNYGMTKAVTEMSMTLKMKGVPTPNIPDPPKLGGQP